MSRFLRASAVLTLAVACGGKATAKHSTPAPAAVAPPVTTRADPDKPKLIAASPHVDVSDDLAKKCKLQLANAAEAPKFGYDKSDLLAADRDVLEQVARCLVRGPLDGKKLELIGRSDPRGTDEYNLGLGTRRADTVRSYLQRLGVPEARMSPTTRGELDATGDDEASWQRDRRVDLELMN